MLYVIILYIITLKQYFHLLFSTVYLHLYSIWFINKLSCYTIFIECNLNHFVVLIDGIFIHINLGS